VRVGIDLGGTKTEGVLLSDTGDILDRKRVQTPAEHYPDLLDMLCSLIEGLSGEDSECPVGIGTPGAVSHLTGNMKNCNTTCLNGKDLLGDIRDKSGRAVRIANDADCFALSEATDGAGAGSKLVFGVILGTGVGGGICYEGRLLRGVNGIAGEWGHNTLPVNAFQQQKGEIPLTGSRKCYCGRSDCVETWIAGPALAATATSHFGLPLTSEQLVERLLKGEETAAEVFEYYCNMAALALSTVINVLDPETIVLGGGLSNIDELYEAIPRYLPRYVFSDEVSTSIVRAHHGDASGVRGAAWLWPV